MTDTRSYYMCHTGIYSKYTCPHGSSWEDRLTKCVTSTPLTNRPKEQTSPSGIGRDNIYLLNEQDITSYRVMTGAGGLTLLPQSCQKGFSWVDKQKACVYNPNLENDDHTASKTQCLWQNQSRCTLSRSCQISRRPMTTDPRSYIVCNAVGKARVYHCAEGYTWNLYHRMCVKEGNKLWEPIIPLSCPPFFKDMDCKGTDKCTFADPYKKTSYYNCDDRLNAVLRDCPRSYEWNDRNEICTKPFNRALLQSRPKVFAATRRLTTGNPAPASHMKPAYPLVLQSQRHSSSKTVVNDAVKQNGNKFYQPGTKWSVHYSRCVS